ncbi:hypothetical protein [Wenyingzhuangia sp. IMCC45467]
MKKRIYILLIFISFGIIFFVGISILEISVVDKNTDNQNYKNKKSIISTLKQNRVLYSYGLDTLNWEKYVVKRKVNLVQSKIERDSTITYNLIAPMDTITNYGSTLFVKHEKSIYISGQKHRVIESKKYINKDISPMPFDLYDLVEPYVDANGPFLFNTDYGILNLQVWSAGLQILYLPNESIVEIEKELLQK